MVASGTWVMTDINQNEKNCNRIGSQWQLEILRQPKQNLLNLGI